MKITISTKSTGVLWKRQTEGQFVIIASEDSALVQFLASLHEDIIITIMQEG